MDSLEDFEKSLAAEKAEREKSGRDRDERRHRKHGHRRHDDDRHRDRHGDRDRDRDRDREGEDDRHRRRHRHRDEDDGNGHRHKRSRHSRDDGSGDDGSGDEQHRRRHRDERHMKASDPKEDLPQPDEELPPSLNPVETSKPQRDAWMTAPSAIDVERVHRRKKSNTPPSKPEPPKRVIHERELNRNIDDGPTSRDEPEHSVDYVIGDAGSSWRMTKLKAVYTAAEESGRAVEDVAMSRFGTLRDFDDAREEMEEMERKKLYGSGYTMKEKPTGDLYRERLRKQPAPEADVDFDLDQGTAVPDQQAPTAPALPAMNQTALNRLRAQMMKAKLRKAPNAAQLEDEYNRASAASAAAAAANPASTTPGAVVLGVMESRQLAGQRNEVKTVDTKRGRERGTVVANDDMTIDDMVSEERRTRGQAGGEGLRLAERIAKDAKYDAGLDYMDENAERLARRVHKSDVNLKSTAVGEFQRMSRALDRCPLCGHDDPDRPAGPVAPVVALATRVFLTLATEPEVSAGGAVVVPTAHRANLLECDDDEWEELRNFMKSLTRMYHDQGRDVVFYENAAAPRRRHAHAALVACPIPYAEGATAPAHFREAFLAEGEEWSQHAKVVDTQRAATKGGLGRAAFRRSFAREAPYFHAWFSLDGGLGHVVDDPERWPRGDLFAREVLGGICGAEPHIVKKQGRWTKADSRVGAWKKAWRKFDWTRALADE